MTDVRTQMDEDIDSMISPSLFTTPEKGTVLLPTTSTEGEVVRQQQSLQQQSKGEWPLQTDPAGDDYEGGADDDRKTTMYDDEDERTTTRYEDSQVSSASKVALEEAQAHMKKEARENEEISAKLMSVQAEASKASAELAAEREKNNEVQQEIERQRERDNVSEGSSRSRSVCNINLKSVKKS